MSKSNGLVCMRLLAFTLTGHVVCMHARFVEWRNLELIYAVICKCTKDAASESAGTLAIPLPTWSCVRRVVVVCVCVSVWWW